MAHYAEVNDNNVVTRVIVVSNQDCLDENGVENETVGSAFCSSIFGGRWVKTSYNTRNGIHTGGGTPFRHTYAGEGMYYDELLDAFYSLDPPYQGWVFNKESITWEPPIPYPSDGNDYFWDEVLTQWEKIKPPPEAL